MQHPFYGKSFTFYIGVWAVIVAAHAYFLYNTSGFSVETSFLDAFILHFFIATYGYTCWYVVKYVTPARQGTYNMVLTNGLAIIAGAFASVYISRVVLNIILNEISYLDFLKATTTLRLIIAFFILTVIILIYYLLQYNYRIQTKEKEEANLQNLLKNAELEMLKFQLNPHFIFNSLNSISSLTLSAPQKAQEMVIMLSDFLRNSLNRSGKEMHFLKDELEHLNHYLNIEKIRFGERLQIQETVDKSCYEQKVPNMILQPLYENAIKHGLYAQLGALTIKIEATCRGNMLMIQLSNNFEGSAITKPGRGIGLQNIRNRLRLLYGSEDLLSINVENNTFEVMLSIPQDNESHNN